MKADPADAVLELALARLLGAGRQVDLAPRIAGAWESGARASAEPEALENPLAPRPAASPPRSVGRLRRAAGLLAAASLLGALAFVAWRARDGAPPPAAVARADRPLRLWDACASRAGAQLLAGELAQLDGPADLELASGAGLAARAGTLLDVAPEQDGARVGLHLGELQLARRAAPPLALDTGFAQVELAPGAIVHARVDRDGPRFGDAALAADLAAGLARGNADLGPRVLRLRVERGEALLAAFKSRERLRVGEERLVPEDALGWQRQRDQESKVLRDLLRTALDAYARADGTSGWGAWTRLRAFLAERPQRWLRLERDVRALLADPAEPLALRELLAHALALDPSAEAERLARALHAELPGALDPPALLALAERGVQPFARALEAGALDLGKDDAPARLQAAALLAFAGDARDAGRLRAAAALEDGLERAPEQSLLAAAALAALGETAPWRDVLGVLEARAQALLARGELEQAARLLAAAELARERLLGRPLAPIGFPQLAGDLSETALDPEALRARLAELLRR